MQDSSLSRLFLVLIGSVLGIGALEGSFRDSFKSENGLAIREEPKRVVFRWNGAVGPDMLEQFDEAFRRRGNDQRPILVSLNSGGGTIHEGGLIIDLIRRMQRTHTIDTVVDAKSSCASMCVPIFMTGTRRSAEAKSRFMFHEVSFGRSAPQEMELRRKLRELKISNEDFKRIEKRQIVAATDEFFNRYLVPNGVDPRWITGIRKSIGGKDVWRTAEQLVAERSGVVDDLD